MTSIQVPTADITIHPRIRKMPRLANDDPRYLNMIEAWKLAKVIPPVYLTEKFELIDGRHRYWFLKSQKAETIPAIVVETNDIDAVILGSLAGRNHISKGTRAYLAYPFVESAYKAAQSRRIAMLTKDPNADLSEHGGGQTVDDLAESLGISHDLLVQARKIHEAFSANADLRKQFESQILAPEDPMGLGACLAGIAGQESTKGRTKPVRNSSFAKLTSAWRNLRSASGKWDKLNPDQQAVIADQVEHTITCLPEPILSRIADTITAKLQK